MLQLHLSDQQFNCPLKCALYSRLDGIWNQAISHLHKWVIGCWFYQKNDHVVMDYLHPFQVSLSHMLSCLYVMVVSMFPFSCWYSNAQNFTMIIGISWVITVWSLYEIKLNEKKPICFWSAPSYVSVFHRLGHHWDCRCPSTQWRQAISRYSADNNISQGSTLSFLAGCPKSHFLGWYRNFLVYWYSKLDNQVVNSTCPKDELGWIWRADDP